MSKFSSVEATHFIQKMAKLHDLLTKITENVNHSYSFQVIVSQTLFIPFAVMNSMLALREWLKNILLNGWLLQILKFITFPSKHLDND